jgi:hypothetical protein
LKKSTPAHNSQPDIPEVAQKTSQSPTKLMGFPTLQKNITTKKTSQCCLSQNLYSVLQNNVKA